MTKDEALKLALEALEDLRKFGVKQSVALVSLREVLAQPDHSWGVDWGNVRDIPYASIIKRLPDGGMEVVAVEYGPPKRTWVGLTDEEIKAMDAGLTSNSSFYAGALWAEAKLKEKNT